jgi:hypothetical protein
MEKIKYWRNTFKRISLYEHNTAFRSISDWNKGTKGANEGEYSLCKKTCLKLFVFRKVWKKKVLYSKCSINFTLEYTITWSKKAKNNMSWMGLSPEGGVGLVPKRGCLLTLAYYAFPRYEFGERPWKYILTGENRKTRRKTCPSATLSFRSYTKYKYNRLSQSKT